MLLQQTAEAQQAGLVLENIYDVQPIVVAAQEERVLNTRHLNAVASTLNAAESLRQQLRVASVARDRQADASSMNGASSGDSQWRMAGMPHACMQLPLFASVQQPIDARCAPPLQSVACHASQTPGLPICAGVRDLASLKAVLQPAAAGAPELLAAIRHCIGREDARVQDRSSDRLMAVRQQRRANLDKLQSQSQEWARLLFAQKASENSQVCMVPASCASVGCLYFSGSLSAVISGV